MGLGQDIMPIQGSKARCSCRLLCFSYPRDGQLPSALNLVIMRHLKACLCLSASYSPCFLRISCGLQRSEASGRRNHFQWHCRFLPLRWDCKPWACSTVSPVIWISLSPAIHRGEENGLCSVRLSWSSQVFWACALGTLVVDGFAATSIVYHRLISPIMLAFLRVLISCEVFIMAISLLLFHCSQDLLVTVDDQESFDCDSLLASWSWDSNTAFFSNCPSCWTLLPNFAWSWTSGRVQSFLEPMLPFLCYSRDWLICWAFPSQSSSWSSSALTSSVPSSAPRSLHCRWNLSLVSRPMHQPSPFPLSSSCVVLPPAPATILDISAISIVWPLPSWDRSHTACPWNCGRKSCYCWYWCFH